MTRLTVSLESTSAANAYLQEDGLLNFSKLATLQARIATAIKASEKTEEPLKVLGTWVMKRRAKPVQFKATLNDKGDLKYLAARATKISLRKRVTPESLARITILLQVIDLPKFKVELKAAQSACAQHFRRMESKLAKVGKEKGKIRDARNANFAGSVTMLREDLLKAGFKETDLVESQGMMGKTLLLRISPDNYVSVSPADKARFNAAKRAAV